MKMLRVLLGLLILTLSSSSAKADLILDLLGTPGSSEVSLQISGSLISQTNVLLGLTINGFGAFVQSDFAFTPLSPAPLLEINRAGNIVDTTNVTHIRSVSSGTGVILEFSPDRFVAANDLFIFSGLATFTLPGAQTFDDFIVGSYSGIPEAGFVGAVTLNIISTPEPSGLWLLVAAGGSIGWFRTRRGVVPQRPLSP